MAIQLSMIVVITSWAPTVAFRKPAIPAHTAPASPAATTATRMCSPAGRKSNQTPIWTAVIVPTMYWPCPPMLKSPQRKAKATARPVRTRTVNWISVCWRLPAARQSSSPGSRTEQVASHGKSQLSPVPLKISLYVDSGFAPLTRRTTRPPMRKARMAVTSGVTIPPARW